MANEDEKNASSGSNGTGGDPPQVTDPEDGGHSPELVCTTSAPDAERICTKEAALYDLHSRTETGLSSGPGNIQRKVISWEVNDKENPHNWTTMRRSAVVMTSIAIIINSTLGSSLPSMAVDAIAGEEEFNVTSLTQLVLPITTFLMGFVFGPVIWGPLSEQYGRRIIIRITFSLVFIWTMACALAPNWPVFLIFRFLCGAAAGGPIAVVAGIIADTYGNPIQRGRAMAWFMAATIWGPLFAPIISGFCATTVGWRWTFWIALIYAGLTIPPVFWLPETFAPVLLSRRAAAIRKKDPSAQVYAAAELEDRGLKQFSTVVLTRPLRMLTTELIVVCTCLYLSLIYSIFYMSFRAFPHIFQDLYGLSPGTTGLCFLPIGLGSFLSVVILTYYDRFLARAQRRNAPWSLQEEYRRIPLTCLGGPIFSFSLFWLGWTSRPDIPFAVPMLAGIPFGMGYMLIFMGLVNYLMDAYEIFAASANAAATASRSFMAVMLPFATTPMFTSLGVAWACSLLGALSSLMCVIPFLFIWKGEKIRAGSKFCTELKRQKAARQRKAAALHHSQEC